MTTNQLNYIKYTEDVRHNLETERQGRSNINIQKYRAETDRGVGTANAIGNVFKGVGGLAKTFIPFF